MSSTVKFSEKLRKPASDTETKALLYLMNFYEDSDKIYYFVVDFFNDLTGIDRMSNKLWDMQSKGAKVRKIQCLKSLGGNWLLYIKTI